MEALKSRQVAPKKNWSCNVSGRDLKHRNVLFVQVSWRPD